MSYLQYPGDGGIMYTPEEYVWARRRPAADRTPIPAVGDQVMWRGQEGGPVVRATVTKVQDLEDISDPNLWYFQTDPLGRPIEVEGQRVLAKAYDPWPIVWVEAEDGRSFHGREARLRGACGWLPPDWETRPQVGGGYLVIPGGV